MCIRADHPCRGYHLLGIEKATNVWPDKKMVCDKLEYVLEDETLDFFWNFEMKTDHRFPDR